MKNNHINIKRKFYAATSALDGNVEITMYGDIVESRPVDYWTGEPLPGNYIVQDEFLADLDAVVASGAKKVRLRINSLGGDAGASILIHNRLRELSGKGIATSCIIDGVAMSGGSLISSGCDTVIVYPSSLIMVHKAWTLVVGRYNADEMRALAQQNDAWDAAQINIYSRKSGLSDTVISHMMSATTFMTGREAIDKGFADELAEDGGLEIAASADRHSIVVGGRVMRLMSNVSIPDTIPEVTAAKAGVINTNTPDTNTGNEGGSLMATNLTELRAEDPALASAVEAEIRAAVLAEHNDADVVRAAVEGERNRLRDIDEISANVDAALIAEAKYGETACTAQELAYRVMKQNAGAKPAAPAPAASGAAFFEGMKADYAVSGVGSVPAAPQAHEVNKPKTREEMVRAPQDLVGAHTHGGEGIR